VAHTTLQVERQGEEGLLHQIEAPARHAHDQT
jgi:hypothetical protein